MSNLKCIIITTISDSKNTILNDIAVSCKENNFGFIIAGDRISPKNFFIDGCEFLDVDAQHQLPFEISKILPDNNYAKKNVAYLQAIKKGYNILIETDDDNIPLEEFWNERSPEMDGNYLENKNWVNVYRYFSDANIWPRGFSLSEIKKELPALDENTKATYFCPVQQGLADENPDVDAFYRLTLPLPVYFNKRANIILGNKSICPFNSQNTTWFKAAFPLMYLPSYCSFRMTDIWRSFIAQRILWTCGWNLAFHNATVYQKRNEHNLIKDLENEISGYLGNDNIVEVLNNLNLKAGEANINENLITCYEALIEKKYFDKKELTLLKAWINDLQKLTR